MVTIYLAHYENIPLKQRRKKEHTLGIMLLSRGLGELYQMELPPEKLSEQIVRGEQGKPMLQGHPEIHFNISHCNNLVACGFFGSPVGIDVEGITNFRDNILRRVLTETEKEYLAAHSSTEEQRRETFFRFWTLKESYIKQSGLGLAMPMTEIAFQLEDLGEKDDLDWKMVDSSDPGLFFAQRLLENGRYVLSVCGEELFDGFEIRYSESSI